MFFKLFIYLLRFIVSLRYRIKVEGLKEISAKKGILFLPNHPAEMDPVILSLLLWPRFKLHPLVVEHFYNRKGLRFFMDLVKALPMPTMDVRANWWRAKKVQKQFDEIVARLKQGENFLIYPSGRLKMTGLEVIGGASFVHKLLQQCPDANVVLIRIVGFWGSSFSRALTGSSPVFGESLWNGVKHVLKNGIFFTPRRRVVVTCATAPDDFPKKGDRLTLNKYLETWYNQYPEYGPEPISLVSFSAWREELPAVAAPKLSNIEETAAVVVAAKIEKEILQKCAEISKRPVESLSRSMNLSRDLGLDSLEVTEFYVFLHERFDVQNLVPGELRTIEDLMRAAAGLREVSEAAPEVMEHKFNWPQEGERSAPFLPEGQTIPEAFLRCCDKMGDLTACADAMSGAVSYRKLKLAALILAKKMKALPGEKIGVLLPSSIGANLVVLAVLFAGKIPVMLNWTAGIRSLDHSVEVTELKTVITSDRFLDRVENGDFGMLEQLFVFLEELRQTISLKDKLWGKIQSWRGTESLLKRIPTHETAVILFTSGTETLPKGVPLTHENLLFDQRACLQSVDLRSHDSMYGVLPSFHSFGFSVTGLLPLLSGLKVFYAPDPNDSHGMARDIDHWKLTLFCCAPSFVSALVRVADPKQLQSLSLLVLGAEKLPQDLIDYAAAHLPKTQLLEGYGITECAPVITLNRSGETKIGVGKPLPGVELIIVKPETAEVLPHGQEGEVCISGPTSLTITSEVESHPL